MNESGFTRSVNKLLPSTIHYWKVNARYAAGVPDCWYSGYRSDLWVEYKYLPKVTKSATKRLSALQRQWLNNRHKEGRNVAVIIGSPLGSTILLDGAWNEDCPTTDLLDKKAVAKWIAQTVGSKDA